MKIVWISHSQKLGGAERSLLEATRGLVEKGHHVHVLLPSPGELVETLNASGALTRVIPYAWWVHEGALPLSRGRQMHKLASHLRAVLRIRAFLRRTHPDIVVTNTLTICAGAIAARSLGLPHCWYIHEFGEEDHGLFFDVGRARALRIINYLSRAILVNSQSLFDHFAQFLPTDKLRLARYAVDTSGLEARVAATEAVRPEGPLKLILMGQIAPGKRQKDALRALALLVERKMDVHLTLVGSEHDAAYSALLRQMVDELNLGSRVEFVAFSPHPLDYLAAADVVLMCSRREAFGRVTVEAMKLGKPVIGANNAGTTELIQDGVNGFLYPCGDAHALATKIEIFERERHLIGEMGYNAQEWALQTFSLENYSETLLGIFGESTR
ncbi:N-acetyl-alpha-D-glucosaminyl L-malate synthase [Abditibacteriota bacterium]|nr:N-acetyl-alpha-D-glucosaminyl L-malate synthase [Abditibacteriota bacterium]